MQKKKDFAMDGLIQLSETLRTLSNDIEGFKSIRHRLFLKASSEKNPADRLYLYLFHLFESLVSNIAVLTSKTTQHWLQQCPQDLIDKVQQEESSSLNGNEGFFAENFKSILKSRSQIDSIV